MNIFKSIFGFFSRSKRRIDEWSSVEVIPYDLPKIPNNVLIAYVKNIYGRIEATLVALDKDRFGIALTNPSEKQVDKMYGKRLACWRALAGFKVPIPKDRGTFFVKGIEYKRFDKAVLAELELLKSRAENYFKDAA